MTKTAEEFMPESRATRILKSITSKAASRPKVDANGNPIEPSTVPVQQYDAHGRPVGTV